MSKVHKLQCRRTCDFKKFDFKQKNLALFRWPFTIYNYNLTLEH